MTMLSQQLRTFKHISKTIHCLVAIFSALPVFAGDSTVDLLADGDRACIGSGCGQQSSETVDL